jgi:hypothetical protein
MIPNINIPYYEDKRLQNQNSQHKKELKQEIYRAFNEGQLYFRCIVATKEVKYLTQKNKDPRPVFLVAPTIPIAMRYKGDGIVTVGIINKKTLFSYKQNATTSNIVNGGGPDIYDEDKHHKCLTDSKALLSKQYELASRRWEVYQIATSGHLQADGNFSLPKFKDNVESDYLIQHSEEIKSKYKLKDIKCYCVELYSEQKITDIITNKKQLEQELNLTNLPIVLYSEKHGTIKIIFVEDINIEQLKQNEDAIECLHLFCGIDIPNNLKHMLPVYSRITAISNLSIADKISKVTDLPYKIHLNSRP